MATLAEIMEDDLQAQRDELPTTITFDTASYTVSSEDFRNSDGMELDGYLASKEGRVTIVLSEFDSPPIENDPRLITISGLTYRVATRENSANGIEATLTLRKQN